MDKYSSFSIMSIGGQIAPSLLTSCAELYCQIWKEPPWNENFWQVQDVEKKIVEAVSKSGSIAFLATENSLLALSLKVIGFTWAFPVTASELAVIAGHEQLNLVFEQATKVLYLAELGVGSAYRKHSFGLTMTKDLISQAKRMGWELIILRTDIEAVSARRLYSRLGFQEMPVNDTSHPTRTYWSLDLHSLS
jgi:ribosomal protein S18 acetylase RimI-like enzyme